jgi:shikimate dehydrogenase
LLDGQTRVYSLYGQPVAHSLSPAMFNGTFKKLGLNCAYLAFEVSPDQLSAAVEAAKSLGFGGFNVTMPLKVAIVSLLDAVSDEANQIGSVNTVVRNAKGLEGQNTDGEGALRALSSYGFEPRGCKVLVIGAGGAARAVVHSLSSEADEIVILNRNGEKARTIADKTRGTAKTYSGTLSRKEFMDNFERVGLIVNATPVQTFKLIETFGLSDRANSPMPWIFDFAYDNESKENVLTRRIHPLELLVQQAGLSYELWFGRPAPIELMRSILVEQNRADWK